jgi:hypothetical protein
MTLALVTSIYGDYDTLTDPPEQEGVTDYVAIVDRHHANVNRWRQVIQPRHHMHPRLAAKVAKCRPDWFTDCSRTVWIDGGARLLHHGAAQWAADHGPFAQFVHPQRDDVTDEAEVSAGMAKYANQRVLEQAAHYKAEGLPDHFGLWATGMIVRDNTFTSPGRLMGDAWLVEQIRWTYQDQLSWPFLLWRSAFRPVALDGNLWGNPHISFTGHSSEL